MSHQLASLVADFCAVQQARLGEEVMVPHDCPGRTSERSWRILVAPVSQASHEGLKICPVAGQGEDGGRTLHRKLTLVQTCPDFKSLVSFLNCVSDDMSEFQFKKYGSGQQG